MSCEPDGMQFGVRGEKPSHDGKARLRMQVLPTAVKPTSHNKAGAGSGRLAAASDPTGPIANGTWERIGYWEEI
jgi:hypothetical protein